MTTAMTASWTVKTTLAAPEAGGAVGDRDGEAGRSVALPLADGGRETTGPLELPMGATRVSFVRSPGCEVKVPLEVGKAEGEAVISLPLSRSSSSAPALWVGATLIEVDAPAEESGVEPATMLNAIDEA
jgi:hypothetical protein